MLPWSADLAGRFETTTYPSELLRDNPLGDPHERPVMVYLPPGYDVSDQRYPSIYVTMGYTGHIGMWFNRTPFRQPYPELLDALFADESVPRAIVVFVDSWTGTAEVSASTRRAPASTTRTCATRSCRGSTRRTGPSPTGTIELSPGNRVVATRPW